MNNLSPLVPQGSFLEQQSKARSRVKTAVFCVLALHIIPITMALLMQGCRKQDEAQPAADTSVAGVELTNVAPVIDTNVTATAVLPATNTPDAATVAGQDYIVKSGDTFSSLATTFGVSVRAIQAANPGVEPTRLRPGQTLHIPPPTAAGQAPTLPGATTAETGIGGEQIYTVKSGDNLTTIATRFHTTVRALRSENNLTTDRIIVGQKLKIPKSTAPVVPTPTPTGTNPM